MRGVCLVLGGADTLHSDLARYDGPVDGVVACNEAGVEWEGKLDAWVSLHGTFFDKKGWRKKRSDLGRPEAELHVVTEAALRHPNNLKPGITDDLTPLDPVLPGMDKTGSSGLFAAKVALVDLGFDSVVFCGVPLTYSPHFFDADKEPWKPAFTYRELWQTIPDEFKARMRSMSGWTMVLFGRPEKESACRLN